MVRTQARDELLRGFKRGGGLGPNSSGPGHQFTHGVFYELTHLGKAIFAVPLAEGLRLYQADPSGAGGTRSDPDTNAQSCKNYAFAFQIHEWPNGGLSLSGGKRCERCPCS